MKRKLLRPIFTIAVLTLALIIGMICLPAKTAAYDGPMGGTSADGFSYLIQSSGNVAIVGYSNTAVTSLTIPATIDGYKVEGIGYNAFNYKQYNSLETVIISEGITYVDYFAFYGCPNLKSVTIPSTMAKMDQAAFCGCLKLERVNITDLSAWCNIYFYGSYDDVGEGLEYESVSNPLTVANNLYLNGTLIKDLVIPKGVTKISKLAFSGGNFTSVTIPDSVTTIGSGAFSRCENLKTVDIPKSVTTVGEQPFYECKSLTKITFHGAAPTVTSGEFGMANTSTVVYFDKTQSGWTTPTWSGAKTEGFTPDPCASGHSFGDWSETTAETCTTAATETRKCKNCDETEARTGDAAKGHSWGDWKVTKAPTTTATGTETRKCNNCTQTESRTVAKLPSTNTGTTSTTDKTTNTGSSADKSTNTNTNADKTSNSGTGANTTDKSTNTQKPTNTTSDTGTVSDAPTSSDTGTDVPSDETVDTPAVDTEINVTKPEENALGGNVAGSADDLKNALLTEDEKDLINDGESLTVFLEVVDIAENILDLHKQQIQTEAGNATVAAWLDISLFKQIGDGDTEKVTDPGAPVTVTVTVPEDLRTPAENMKRIFSMIRIHNDAVETLPAVFDALTGLLSFETDGFSTYALIYEDVAAENTESDASGTSTDANADSATDLPTVTDGSAPAEEKAFPWWIVIVCGVIVLAAGGACAWYFLIFKKKKPAQEPTEKAD